MAPHAKPASTCMCVCVWGGGGGGLCGTMSVYGGVFLIRFILYKGAPERLLYADVVIELLSVCVFAGVVMTKPKCR